MKEEEIDSWLSVRHQGDGKCKQNLLEFKLESPISFLKMVNRYIKPQIDIFVVNVY